MNGFRIPFLIQGISFLCVSLFWVFFILIPLSFTLIFGNHFSQFKDLLFNENVLNVVLSTLKQASLSVLASSIFGLILGLQLGKYLYFYPNSRIQSFFALPFGIPNIVTAAAWVCLLGRSGYLAKIGWNVDWIYSLKGVILAHTFLNVPLVALTLAQCRKGIPREQIEAARTLGAHSFSEFRFLIWPQIRWAWASAASQVMALCVMSFALVLILGGGPPVQSLETALYQKLRFGTPNLLGASVFAFWEFVISIIPWIFVVFCQKRKPFSSIQKVGLSKRNSLGSKEACLRDKILLWGSGVIIILPYFAVLNRFTLTWVLKGSERDLILKSLFVSFFIAFSSGLLTLLMAVFALICLVSLNSHFVRLRESWVSVLLGLPSGISILVLSLGFWLAYGEWIDPFEGNLFLIIGLQSVIFFPLSFRILWPVFLAIQKRDLETAFTLGANPLQAFRWIEWPRWRGPLFSAFAAVAGASLGELGAVSLFYNEKIIPLPLLISRWMQNYRFQEAQGIAGLLFLFSLIFVFISIEGSYS